MVFSIGALLIALNMSAVYSLLLTLTLAVFILQTIQFYLKITSIASTSFSPDLIPVGVLWGIISVLATYIFLGEIVNTVAERHIIPLGNAVFDYKTFKPVNPFR